VVAEDDAELCAAIAETLRQGLAEVSVVTVGSGSEAWDELRRRPVDLLLSDVVMPGLDGVELARKVRQNPATADTYVILLTGVAPPEALFEAIEDGADDCLLKPIRWDELIVRVRAGLRRVRSLQCLKARGRELERLASRQSEYLSWVSHEIRTPLSAIQSSANILMRYGRQRPESVERFASVIHQEGKRLTRLINNLLDLQKIEAGEVDWHFTSASLADLVERVRESFSALVGERNLRLETADCAHGSTVHGDPDKLTQVLENLVSNAIKHSPEGGTVRLRCGAKPQGGVRIEVEDEGPGIPAGSEERVFERFQQLDAGDEKRGTGLGLTISRQIIDHHGGRIWAEGRRARGALFVVELPEGPQAGAGDGPV
jgi:signal transduction histidine kinase